MTIIRAIQEIVTFPQFVSLFNFLSHICIEKVPPEKVQILRETPVLRSAAGKKWFLVTFLLPISSFALTLTTQLECRSENTFVRSNYSNLDGQLLIGFNSLSYISMIFIQRNLYGSLLPLLICVISRF